jgi:YVTN family beta-propeller protein
MDRSIRLSGLRRWLVVLGFGVAGAMGIAPAQAQQLCGGVDYPFPYTDVSGVGAAFCPGIMEAYVTGVSKGTTPTTFSPNNTVTRVQMTTFLQRSLDQGLARTSRRAALDQWSTPQNTNSMQTVVVGGTPYSCAADGENIWVATSDSVVQVLASSGIILSKHSGGVTNSTAVRVAAGKVWITGENSPGDLYVIDPPGGGLSAFVGYLGNSPVGLAFDGTSMWTANFGPPGSVSIVTPTSTPFTISVQEVTTGFNAPYGALYDGSHIWITDNGANTLLKLDSAGNIIQTVSVGSQPQFPVFDGINIWVPNEGDNSITVVQASSGNVVATIGGLNNPFSLTFDGERILATNVGTTSVSVFKAADLSLVATVSTGAAGTPYGACSDGINFWVTTAPGNLLRF